MRVLYGQIATSQTEHDSELSHSADFLLQVSADNKWTALQLIFDPWRTAETNGHVQILNFWKLLLDYFVDFYICHIVKLYNIRV